MHHYVYQHQLKQQWVNVHGIQLIMVVEIGNVQMHHYQQKHIQHVNYYIVLVQQEDLVVLQ